MRSTAGRLVRVVLYAVMKCSGTTRMRWRTCTGFVATAVGKSNASVLLTENVSSQFSSGVASHLCVFTSITFEPVSSAAHERVLVLKRLLTLGLELRQEFEKAGQSQWVSHWH